jgi:hypothetical protein
MENLRFQFSHPDYRTASLDFSGEGTAPLTRQALVSRKSEFKFAANPRVAGRVRDEVKAMNNLSFGNLYSEKPHVAGASGNKGAGVGPCALDRDSEILPGRGRQRGRSLELVEGAGPGAPTNAGRVARGGHQKRGLDTLGDADEVPVRVGSVPLG